MDTALAVRAYGIRKCFGDVVALDGVDLEVAAGRIHGLVGPNGAGKTTLLGLLLCLAAADSGTLEVLGRPAGRAAAAPEGVAGFVDGPGLYPSLTARQNLAALAALRGGGRGRARGRDAAVGAALAEVGLTDVADDRARGFSLGMRQRLGLAAALLTAPRLLVLDEPANGLDPAGKHHVHGVLTRLAAEGTAVVLSSHRMDDVEALCSEVTLLSTGRVAFSGPLRELAALTRASDYRLLTSDPPTAARLAAATPGIRVIADATDWRGSHALVVRTHVPPLDALVAQLVHEGVAVRELSPVVSPLESAFLTLTGADAEADAPAQADAGPDARADLDAHAEPDAQPEAAAHAQAEPDRHAGPNTHADADAGPDAHARPNPDRHADPDADAEPDAEVGANRQPPGRGASPEPVGVGRAARPELPGSLRASGAGRPEGAVR